MKLHDLAIGAALAGALLYALGRRRASASPSAPRSMSSGVYQTKASDVTAPAEWWTVGDAQFGLLGDSHTGGFARLSYAEALQALPRTVDHGDLPTAADLDALSDAARSRGVELRPITFPDAGMLEAAGVDPHDAKAVNALRAAHMRSEQWTRTHDALARVQVAIANLAPDAPVSNLGKAWIEGAAPGRARLKGWRRPDGTWTQTGETDPHDDSWSDYGTLTLVKRPLPG